MEFPIIGPRAVVESGNRSQVSDWQLITGLCNIWFGTLSRAVNIINDSNNWLVHLCVCSFAMLCPTLCVPTDCSLPGSSVHGTFKARILEWVAMPFSRGSYWPRDQTYASYISCIGRRVFTNESPGKTLFGLYYGIKDRHSPGRSQIFW